MVSFPMTNSMNWHMNWPMPSTGMEPVCSDCPPMFQRPTWVVVWGSKKKKENMNPNANCFPSLRFSCICYHPTVHLLGFWGLNLGPQAREAVTHHQVTSPILLVSLVKAILKAKWEGTSRGRREELWLSLQTIDPRTPLLVHRQGIWR